MKNRAKTRRGLIAVAVILVAACAVDQRRVIDAGEDAAGKKSDSRAAEEKLLRPVLGEVLFQRGNGKEEVHLVFSVMPADIELMQRDYRTLVLASKSAEPAKGSRDHYVVDGSSIIRRVTVRRSGGGVRPGLEVIMDLVRPVTYRMTSSGSSVVLSFDSQDRCSRAPAVQTTPGGLNQDDFLQVHLDREALRIQEEEPTEFNGDKLSIICQDARINSVFRLISEVSGYSIVSGPDVNQKVTLHMRNVPWDQALKTIMEINELGMTRLGKVITVMPLEKMREAEEKRLERHVAEGRVRQISIEAKIVEVSTSFDRDLGVRWGAGIIDTWGRRNVGVFMGEGYTLTNRDNVTYREVDAPYAITADNIAVNFPAGIARGATPTLGIVAASSKYVLDAQLKAMETKGEGKIISSPKVTTVENKTATISQGEEIPYFSREEAGSTPDVQFKRAALSLSVTPQITVEGKLSMVIDAGNDYADWSRAEKLGLENPPIVTNRVGSTVIVNDGDTIVIGGIYKSSEITSGSGVPWLSDIPVLGWLFKDRSVQQEQRELLIFITPMILDPEASPN